MLDAWRLVNEYARTPQPSVPSGEAVAWVMTFHGKMLMDSFFLDEAEAKANKGMRDRKYGDAEFRGLIPLYAAPPQERVSEELREAAKFAIQVLDEQATISRTMEHLNGSITEHARAVGLEAMHKPAHGVSLALRRLTAALSA
jgi:hypothetical protein